MNLPTSINNHNNVKKKKFWSDLEIVTPDSTDSTKTHNLNSFQGHATKPPSKAYGKLPRQSNYQKYQK